MSADPFCPQHGRASRPIEVPGLRCDCRSDRARIYQEIDDERARQERKFPGILVEELGEAAVHKLGIRGAVELARILERVGYLAEALDEGDANTKRELRAELVQVAACTVGWLEAL